MTNPLFDALFAPLAGRNDPFLILPDGGAITGMEFHAMCARGAGAGCVGGGRGGHPVGEGRPGGQRLAAGR